MKRWLKAIWNAINTAGGPPGVTEGIDASPHAAGVLLLKEAAKQRNELIEEHGREAKGRIGNRDADRRLREKARKIEEITRPLRHWDR